MGDQSEQLSLEEVRHVAKLARIRLTDTQLEVYRSQLAQVLEYIDKLKELNVNNVEPLAHPTEITNRLDEDEIQPTMSLEDFFKNAPARKSNFIVVPKVLTDE